MTKAEPKRPLRPILRVLLAGPLALITSTAAVSSSAVWLPHGAAGINHLMLPLFLFPAVWAGLFLYACLDRILLRAYAVHVALLCFSAILVLPRPG